MAMLTPSQVHLDVPLTNLTLAYMQNEANFIADRVFPIVDVSKQSDKYYVWPRGQFNRASTENEIKLAPRTRPERVGLELSSDSYFADVYGLETDFDDQTLANEDTVLDIRSAGANLVLNRLMISREIAWANNYFATSVWGTEVAGGTSGSLATGEVVAWDDYTNSTPLIDVTNAARAVQLASGGFKPNTLVLGKKVRDKLIHHPDFLARINGGATVSNPAMVTDSAIAAFFGVERLFVMDAVYNTSAEGVAESNAFIGGNHALFCYTPANAGLMTPAAGLTFAWNSIPGASFSGLTVERFSGDWLRVEGIAEVLQVKMTYDMKVTASELGYFFKDIVS